MNKIKIILSDNLVQKSYTYINIGLIEKKIKTYFKQIIKTNSLFLYFIMLVKTFGKFSRHRNGICRCHHLYIHIAYVNDLWRAAELQLRCQFPNLYCRLQLAAIILIFLQRN